MAWTRGPVARIVIVTVALRLATALLAFFAQVTIPAYQDQGFGVYRERHAFWDNFARYDSGWYHGIARNGYQWVEGGRNNLAFFPVYPMAMRASGLLLGGKPADFYFGGIAVSWVACMVAMLLLYRLARLDVDEDAAERAVPYALLYPFAFFFGVVYSESLFLMLVLGAFYGFRTRRWALGAVRWTARHRDARERRHDPAGAGVGGMDPRARRPQHAGGPRLRPSPWCRWAWWPTARSATA